MYIAVCDLHERFTKLFLTIHYNFQATKEADLGQIDLDDEVEKRKEKLYVPNWFSVEVKTGVSNV